MANSSFRTVQRIQRELKEIMKEEFSESGIAVEATDDDLMKLRAKLLGPPDTPYEGGVYLLEILVPDGYPFSPVKIRFVTKIWHPNISSVTGTICMNILKNDWRACITLRTVLISIQALLSSAEPDSPQDFVVASQYKKNYDLFKLTAMHWAHFYAGAPGSNSVLEEKIEYLTTRGVDTERALIALSSTFWDIGNAVNFILR